jgi:hypothetical protein
VEATKPGFFACEFVFIGLIAAILRIVGAIVGGIASRIPVESLAASPACARRARTRDRPSRRHFQGVETP